MLTPEELKPHILHQDRWIRIAALDRFTETWSLDPEIAALALTAHERYFQLGEFPRLNGIHQLRIDAGTVKRILALLDTTPSRIVVIHINWCLASLPLDILRMEGGRIDDHPRLNDEARQKIRYRRRIGDLSDEALWEEFLEFSGREKMKGVPHLVDPLTRPLVEELASRRMPDAEGVCALIRSPAFRGTFFEDLLVQVAGVRRLKAAMPRLVAMLHPGDEDDDEGGNVSCQEALVRISHPHTVSMIRKRWWDLQRESAACVLGQIPTPESEEALVQLFEEDDDPGVRFFIADGLCQLFSRKAVPSVLCVLRQGAAYDEEALREKLLPVIDFFGIEIPEAGSWRKERQEKLAQSRSPEEPCPEALEIHKKILGAMKELDRADEMLAESYLELGKHFAEPESEEEPGDPRET